MQQNESIKEIIELLKTDTPAHQFGTGYLTREQKDKLIEELLDK